MTTQRRLQRGSGRPRARLLWRAFATETPRVVASDATSIVALDSEGPAPNLAQQGALGDYTLRRLRFTLCARSITTTALSFPLAMNWGVTIVASEAFDQGPAALPDPEGSPADWLAYGSECLPQYGNGLVISTQIPITVYVDNKSMRKVNASAQVMAFIAKNGMTVGPSLEYTIRGRLLVSYGRE